MMFALPRYLGILHYGVLSEREQRGAVHDLHVATFTG